MWRMLLSHLMSALVCLACSHLCPIDQMIVQSVTKTWWCVATSIAAFVPSSLRAGLEPSGGASPLRDLRPSRNESGSLTVHRATNREASQFIAHLLSRQQQQQRNETTARAQHHR
jgi:hypothetical protein